MTQGKPMRHNLPSDLATCIDDLLAETAVTHWGWWEIAFNIRAETQKLIDKQESITDPVHAELCQALIQDGLQAYNNLISAFVTAGLRSEGMKYRQRHAKSIQIISNALNDPKRND